MRPERRMAPKKPAAKKAATVKPKVPAPAKPVSERPVYDRGTEWAVHLEVMARQYLDCPSTSATMERLFSAVGLVYADKR